MEAIFMSMLLCCSSANYQATNKKIDIQKMMKPWHVITGRLTMLERDPFNSIEDYTWNEKKQRIDIDFSYNKGSFDGPLKKIPQKAWVHNKETNAHWKVKPKWFPFKMDYLVLDIADDYSWVAVGVPNGNYLWVMSEKKSMDKSEVAKILEGLAPYPVHDLVEVKHR